MFGFFEGYFSLPQGYPYQWQEHVYYPVPYIPPHLPMYSYPESCCCFDHEMEPEFSEISNQEISADGGTMPEIAAKMTSTTDHPTTSTITGRLSTRLRAETNTGVSEEEIYRFLQQTELIIEPTKVSIYEIAAEFSTTALESNNQSKTELNTQSIAETNTEPVTESSTKAPEGTESTTESIESATVTTSKFTTKLTEPKQQLNTKSTIKPTDSTTESAELITETTAESIIKMTESTQGSTTESTTYESVPSAETAKHEPQTPDGSTTKSSESTVRSTDKSTKKVTESTTQTTVDFQTETTTETTVSTSDSIPIDKNQYNVEGITTSTMRATEGNMMINTITGKEYLLEHTTGVSAEYTNENCQHLNTALSSEIRNENNEVLMSGFTRETFSDDINGEISQTEDDDFPYIDPA
jgi:hypothetical protein